MARINISLDDEHAERLNRLAARTHVQPGTLARPLLSTALEDADGDPSNIVALLDGLPDAFARAQLGLRVATVELARAAVEDFEALIRSHSLPADTRARFRGRGSALLP